VFFLINQNQSSQSCWT